MSHADQQVQAWAADARSVVEYLTTYEDEHPKGAPCLARALDAARSACDAYAQGTTLAHPAEDGTAPPGPACACRDSNGEGPIRPVSTLHYRYCPLYATDPYDGEPTRVQPRPSPLTEPIVTKAPVIHRFCAHCGRIKQADANYVDDCGWVSSTFVFCANCGQRKGPSRNYVHDECLCRDTPRAEYRDIQMDNNQPAKRAGIDVACFREDGCAAQHDCDGYHVMSPHYGHCCHTGHQPSKADAYQALATRILSGADLTTALANALRDEGL